MEYMENQIDDLITGANLQQEEINSFKLIPMTDFILEHPATTDYEWQLTKHLKYAQFLKQPLTLGMFVPCDEGDNVLEEPKKENFITKSGLYQTDYHNKAIKKYQQAKERVLFEGFYYESNFSEKQNKLYKYVRNKHPHVFSFEQINNSTVETLLTGYKEAFLITLTETAIKQIGL